MDAVELEASLCQNQAQTRQDQAALNESAAQVDLRKSECVLSGKELARAEKLFVEAIRCVHENGWIVDLLTIQPFCGHTRRRA